MIHVLSEPTQMKQHTAQHMYSHTKQHILKKNTMSCKIATVAFGKFGTTQNGMEHRMLSHVHMYDRTSDLTFYIVNAHV